MLGLLNTEKAIVGYDLQDNFSQISYCLSENGEIETLSSVAGEERYNIPTVLCKRAGVNQWFYGKEALRYAEEEQGILVQNLVSLAVDGEPIQIEEKSYDPVALLALFLKRSLGLLGQITSVEKIGALMITCEKLDYRLLEILNQAVSGLRLKTENIYFQSHAESYYNYMIHQPEELWRNQSVLFYYSDAKITVYRMECNRRTTPIVAFIDSREYPFSFSEPKDLDFLRIAEEVCNGNMIGSVFLIGDFFSEEWMKESLRYLCKGRRVFQGNNLYSKGACYGMQERMNASEAGKNHVFLGNDKLKANIGMNILRQGEESYYALLDAGVNWFEAEQTVEFYLQDGNSVEFIITPLIGKGNRLAQIILEDLQEGLCRLSAHLHLVAENLLEIEIEDCGLGEFRAATHHVWKEQIELY